MAGGLRQDERNARKADLCDRPPAHWSRTQPRRPRDTGIGALRAADTPPCVCAPNCRYPTPNMPRVPKRLLDAHQGPQRPLGAPRRCPHGSIPDADCTSMPVCDGRPPCGPWAVRGQRPERHGSRLMPVWGRRQAGGTWAPSRRGIVRRGSPMGARSRYRVGAKPVHNGRQIAKRTCIWTAFRPSSLSSQKLRVLGPAPRAAA